MRRSVLSQIWRSGPFLYPDKSPQTSCGAHSIRVDAQGNIWAVDAPGHVIYKMNPQGKVIMQLGQKGVSGLGPTNFNLPTDVAFAPNGDVYVSDGYGNPRVVKYSRAGKYLLQWGTRGSGPGQFQLPHNVAVDARGRVYVTDRDNRRVEVFDSSGKFLSQWPDTGGVSALRITKDHPCAAMSKSFLQLTRRPAWDNTGDKVHRPEDRCGPDMEGQCAVEGLAVRLLIHNNSPTLPSRTSSSSHLLIRPSARGGRNTGNSPRGNLVFKAAIRGES